MSDWNPAAERLLGWTAQEAVGSDLAELIVPPAHRQTHRLEHTRLVASGVRNLLAGPVEMPSCTATAGSCRSSWCCPRS